MGFGTDFVLRVSKKRTIATFPGVTVGFPVSLTSGSLIGLRGAGKSTLGQRLAVALGRPFVELGVEVTRIAGLTPAGIQDLYGPAAYRRYEAQALKETLASIPKFVLATPGGIVSDTGSFSLLLSRCLTVWLQATPQEHMERVLARETCGRWRATARRWMTSKPSFGPGRPSTRRRTWCSTRAVNRRTRRLGKSFKP